MRVPGVSPTSFDPPGQPVGTAVLVPGRGYSPQAPLLFFAGMALLQHGWRVEHLWWDPPAEAAERNEAWVRREVEQALPSSGGALLVGKSLGTLAAPLAAERELPAIWLTPVLDDPEVVDGIGANPAPQLLVGGSADDLWDTAVARGLSSSSCTVFEIPDVDHAMLLPGDVIRGLEAHVEVTRAIDNWLASAFVRRS